MSTKCCLRSHLQVRHQCVTPLSKLRNEHGAELFHSRQKDHFKLDFRIPTQEGGVDVGVVVRGGGCVMCVL